MAKEENKSGKRYFQIKYDINQDAYILQVLEDRNGIFVKIGTNHTLRNNDGISFGDIEFVTILPPIIDKSSDSSTS